MRIRWRNLELPTKVVADPATRTDTYAKFTAEPFERGYGVTVGNGIRRVLLSSIEGSAVTSVKIQGAKHEFSSLDGIKEDVTDIVLALKRLRVKFHSDDPKVLTIEKKGPGPVTGADVQTGSDCEVVNKDLVLATLTEDLPFDMTLTVGKGRGYVTAAEHLAEQDDDVELGAITVDSLYSPVSRVRYATEDARVGQKTDYDRLILEIWTNGTISPEMALVEASKILRKHLNPFVQYFELGTDTASDDAIQSMRDASKATMDPELEQKLSMTVQELDLSVRANNCLESAKIGTVRDLVKKTDGELLKVRSFGKTSLREVKRKLADLGLSLGMDLDSPMPQSATMPDDDDDDDFEDEESEGAESSAEGQ
jgi:DNA-directed RNA polymerase subunit alpha